MDVKVTQHGEEVNTEKITLPEDIAKMIMECIC